MRVIFVPTARKPAVTAALQKSPLVVGTFKDAILHTMGVITNDVFFNQQWGLQLQAGGRHGKTRTARRSWSRSWTRG